ncbi:MAG: cadmium-translocating P-type ATPase [Alphaproteobacteria bacterium]|nr:cadmium-translocating P-type ATPase [Alphaproteobacteria bacterium]
MVVVSALGLIFGFIAPQVGFGSWQQVIWGGAAAAVLAALLGEIVHSLRKGEVGLDIVAGLSMSVAIAFGETLAAAVVSLMYSGGQLLEDFASSRARAEMKSLLDRAPKVALRYIDGQLETCPIGALVPGDRVLVRQGEIVPVDGRVISGAALLDMAALTGESVPVKAARGTEVLSGGVSLDMAFDLEVTRPAAESAYSAIVRLVKAAQEAKAPMVRLADRYALWFLALTVILAAAAYLASGDRMRLLAVLVVATPCPLILAVPVAIVSGISRAARHGVLLKGGPVLETMARASVLVIDKTGTLTHGRAELSGITVRGRRRAEDVLRLAASLDQASGHAIAQSIVQAAHLRGLRLSQPDGARETPGEGVEGHVDGHRVIVGGSNFVRRRLRLKQLHAGVEDAGAVMVAVAIDGRLAGQLVLADQLREDAPTALARLRQAGVRRVILASGDSAAVAERIGAALGLDEVRAELSPQQKVDIVVAERRNGTVLMAGDGVNDAPALAAADIGIAMGARGSAASAEAADAVLLVDDLERVAEAVEISARSRRIALESVYVGLGLSIAAMVAAAFGYLPVLEGALLQEAIDLAVILNALRALR